MTTNRSEKLPDGKYKCVQCEKISETQQSISSHWWRNHTEHGRTHNSGGRPKGIPGWNKGLTKDTDDRVKKNSESLALTMRQKVKDGSYIPITNSDEWREKTSNRQSIRNSGGRCKWFEYKGVRLQGTWELSVAKKLDELNVKWQKVTKPWTYRDDSGKTRKYTPDFFLEEFNIFLEIKGYWWGDDERKMKLVIEQHSENKIVLVQKDQYEMILRGELFWCKE